MADLVTLAEQKTFLEISVAGDDTLIQALLDHCEELFERQAGRGDVPFKASATGVTEVHDGTGGNELFLNYDIAALTTVKLGLDTSDPVETLDPTDVNELAFGVGERRLVRTDGGFFGRSDSARYVHVTYDHQADLPEDAMVAIKSVVAAVFRRRGSEDARQEREGTFSHVLAKVALDDPLWQMAVGHHTRLVLA